MATAALMSSSVTNRLCRSRRCIFAQVLLEPLQPVGVAGRCYTEVRGALGIGSADNTTGST